MILTVLGCNGPWPAAGGATSGYLVEEQGEALLMDCGSGVLSGLMRRMDPAELQGVLLTHLHFDHMSDLFVLQYYLQNVGKTLPVYVPEEALPLAQQMLSTDMFHLNAYKPSQRIGMFDVETAPTRHPVASVALRVTCGSSRLVYTGDAAEGDSLTAFCQNAGFLLADGAFLHNKKKENAPHMSAHEAAGLARRAGVKKLMITHFPPNEVTELLLAEARRVYPKAQAAVIGRQIEI